MFFYNPPDFLLEAGDTGSHPFQASGGIPGFGNFFPEESVRFHFSKFVECVAYVAQSIESLSINGKRVELCFDCAQLTFERLEFSLDLLDLSFQWRQFLLQNGCFHGISISPERPSE